MIGAPNFGPFAQSQLSRLKTQLLSVDLLFATAGPERADRRTLSGKWSARENLAHIGRYHEVFLARLGRILTESAPRLPRYRAEEDPEWPQWASRPLDDVRLRLAPLRAELVSRVTGLRPQDFARLGVHSSFGEMTLDLWLEFFLVHEAHHLYVILQRLREP